MARRRSVRVHGCCREGGSALIGAGQRPVAWLRGSGRDGGKAIPMHGYLGKLTLEGDLAPFLPVLAVGAVTGAGGNAALGLGQYDLIVEP